MAFIGNVANSHFRAVKALRAQGIDAHLFVTSIEGAASRPENDDPALLEGYPTWIHLGAWITPRSVLLPWRSAAAQQLATFDVVVASGPAPMFAQFSGRPWCFFVTGADLTIKPFPWSYWRRYPTWRLRVAEFVAGLWQRRAARRADELWLQPFAPMRDAADRLGVPSSQRAAGYFPIVVDVDRYGPEAPISDSARAYASQVLDEAAFVIFHPSRMVMDASPSMVRTGQWKGNDVLLRAFARFTQLSAADGAVLAIPDSGISRDVAAAKELAAELGIADRIRWLRPPDGNLFNQDFMVALYGRSDVVAADFGVGWFGYTALEGLAMGKPVLNRLDESVMRQLYDQHPIVSTPDEQAIIDRLAELATDAEYRARVGAESRAFVERFHSQESAGAVYRRTVESLAAHAAQA